MSDMPDAYILYGLPHSLYTGKIRAYLRKQGIRYVERAPSHPGYRDEVLPQIKRSIIPVLVCPDGTIVQDSVDILDHFEAQGVPVSARPPGPRQLIAAHVLEIYGSVGMTRHAMHYRWSYADRQAAFLQDAFAGRGDSQTATAAMGRMASYLPVLGVTAETIPAIEESYERLLDILQAHFAVHPYLFGGRPSLGDYGLLGPLFAHLARDPAPEAIMKARAPKVFRWVERMNAPDADTPEYRDYPDVYLPDDEIAPTLRALLVHAAEELFPELTDKLDFLRRHVRELAPAPGDPVAAKPHQRMIGRVETTFRGAPFESGAAPYTMYLWQRITDDYAAMSDEAKASVRALLADCGLTAFLDAERPFRVERRDHIEVWG